MKVGLGADHRGFSLKETIKKKLKMENYEVKDFGVFEEEQSDYPDFAFKLGESLSKGEIDTGILICFTGIGMSIAANKVKGVRAALCRNYEDAEFSRRHNDANVLVLSFREQGNFKIVQKFLKTPFEGGRHKRRVLKIKDYEDKNFRG